MHHLVGNPYIKDLPKDTLRVCHLVLRYDRESNTLVYDRKLKDGQGDSVYGLEVAMSLGITPDFIDKASFHRKEYLNIGTQLLNTKRSKYNKNVYVDSCALCSKKPNIKSYDKLNIHHIEPQTKADSKGFIDSFHKNSGFNLLVLCESCHDNLHANGLKITTAETSAGRIIKIEK